MSMLRLYRSIGVIGLAATLAACNKPAATAEPKAPAPKAVGIDAPEAAPPPAANPGNAPAAETTDPAAAGAGAPAPANEPAATPEETAKFNPPEPMNAYAKRGPGDYQAQLDLYNRVLRTWSRNADRPATFKDLMATYNSPKPPEPPAGRKLVYDPKTVSVRLE